MLREWLITRLSGITELTQVVGDRIWQNTSITDIPGTKPFILYRLGTSSVGLPGDDAVVKRIQPVQIFVHDIPGDYDRIDTLLGYIRTGLEGQSSADITRCEWLEESEDLRDDEMFTILRFARYQILH